LLRRSEDIYTTVVYFPDVFGCKIIIYCVSLQPQYNKERKKIRKKKRNKQTDKQRKRKNERKKDRKLEINGKE
jgi:hypothetical protein